MSEREPCSAPSLPTTASARSSTPSTSPTAAKILLTLPRDAVDPLTGTSIAPGVLGVAANGCITVGGAYLRVGYGSALTEGGRAAALAGIGTYRLGQTLPALHGYPATFAAGRLPAELRRCGPGAYVTAPVALAARTNRAEALAVGNAAPGRATTLNGRLDAGGNGCARVGGSYLLAPRGSALVDGGAAIRIRGVGTYRMGIWMPTLAAQFVFYETARLPAALQRCGPGPYVAVSVEQDQPVLVFDAENDSARLVVRPATKAAPPGTRAVQHPGRGGVRRRARTDRFAPAGGGCAPVRVSASAPGARPPGTRRSR